MSRLEPWHDVPPDARPEADRSYEGRPEAMPPWVAVPVLGVLLPHIRFNGATQVSGSIDGAWADVWALSSMIGGAEVGVAVRETRLHLT